MKGFNASLKKLNESIFSQVSKKANDYGAINLSQGFPDFSPPLWIRESVLDEFVGGNNQYAPSKGCSELLESLVYYYNMLYGKKLTSNQILVTNGATQAIYLTISSLVNPGDEVILFEPYYDAYLEIIKLCGGVPKYISLNGPEFTFEKNELEKVFTEKTKLIIVNTPHNPTGKIFSNEELNQICAMVRKFKCYILSDEVYENFIFDNRKFLSLVKRVDAASHCIVVSSIGKTLGVTGWKVGWVVACDKIINMIHKLHQYNVFSVCSPLQRSVAKIIKDKKFTNYLSEMCLEYEEKRDILLKGLISAGLKPITSHSTFFTLIDIENTNFKDDCLFCDFILEKLGVAGISMSYFYFNKEKGKKLVRLCFAKQNETLHEAVRKLKEYNFQN